MPALMRTLLLIGLLMSMPWAGPLQAEAVYRVGVVPQFSQRTLHGTWRPILDELERRTGVKFKLTGSPRIPAFEREFMAGNFDFVYMNPYHFVKGHEAQGYLPLIRDGARQLYGILVVDKDSPITDVKSLEGKTLAFPSPRALGASLLLQAELKQKQGIRIKPKYVQTHSSVYLHVARQLVDGGGGVMSTLHRQPEELQQRMRVIYETERVAPHPFVAHPRVARELRESVRQSLLDMGKDSRMYPLFRKVPWLGVSEARVVDYESLKRLKLEDYYVP